jgi:hypothetical protein
MSDHFEEIKHWRAAIVMILEPMRIVRVDHSRFWRKSSGMHMVTLADSAIVLSGQESKIRIGILTVACEFVRPFNKFPILLRIILCIWGGKAARRVMKDLTLILTITDIRIYIPQRSDCRMQGVNVRGLIADRHQLRRAGREHEGYRDTARRNKCAVDNKNVAHISETEKRNLKESGMG